jgi:Cys-rich repeat protein
MDAGRFDAISRALGTETRRRGMLKAAAGGALGVLGVSRLTDSAQARRCKTDNDCNRNDVCKKQKCVECKSDKDCSKGNFCDRNQCVECIKNRDCKSNQRCTNGKCKSKS